MRADIIDALGRSEFLRFMPAENHQQIQELFRPERHEFGETIVRQDEAAEAFYVLLKGRLRVVKLGANGEEISLASLRPGDEFGESALLNGGKRNATVRCSTPVEVLRLNRDDFLALLARFPELKEHLEIRQRHRVMHGFLYEFSNFGRLPAPALIELIRHASPVHFKKGELVIRQKEPAGPMYVVSRGRIRVFTGNNGRHSNRAFYREGDFFGELSALTGAPRAASAEAVTDCDLLALDVESLQGLERDFPEFHKLMEERRAQYSASEEARAPLDFNTELLPADTQARNKTEVDDESEEAEEEGDPSLDRRRRRIGKIPFVGQIDEMDCGAASLAMVCRHFGRAVSLSRIRQLCHTAFDGTSLKGMCHAASELGLAARALKVSLFNLDKMALPAIVHWEGNHWMVLFRVGAKHVHVADPASGIRRIRRDEFEQKWSGYAALFDYTAAFERAPEQPSTLLQLLPFFDRFRAVFVEVLALAGIVTCMQILFPIFTQLVVDKVIVEHDPTLLRTVLIAMAVVIVFMQLANLSQQFLLSFCAVRVDAAIRDFLTRQLLSLPMSYFQSRRTGDIQRRMEGARQIREFAVQHGIGGVFGVATLLGAVVVMTFYSFKLAAVFLATVPLYGLLMYFSVKVLRPLFAEIEERQGKYSAHQIDAIKGMEAVKASAAELTFRDAMLSEFLSVSKQMFRTNFMMLSCDNIVQGIGMISTALFLWVGANMVMAGEITVGSFVAFSALTAISYAAIIRVLGIWDHLQLVNVLLNRLRDVFENEPEQGADHSHLRPVQSLEGHIELRNLGFKYGGPEAPPILNGINLEIAPGKLIAIVGRSGCGKTTLIKLIAGLVEPTEGTILFDHTDLKTLNYRELRRQIGIVLQENHMFADSIARNIAFGDMEPDYDRVFWAAQTANAHDFIMRLPLGYETPIGESGLLLSGGQKQRIAIARAIYGKPPILIFDEATSALDSESERAIQGNLSRLTGGRTSIIIAHRLSTIRDADMIVVLEKGEIAETGTHDELMARRGLYFYLSSQQLGI